MYRLLPPPVLLQPLPVHVVWMDTVLAGFGCSRIPSLALSGSHSQIFSAFFEIKCIPIAFLLCFVFHLRVQNLFIFLWLGFTQTQIHLWHVLDLLTSVEVELFRFCPCIEEHVVLVPSWWHVASRPENQERAQLAPFWGPQNARLNPAYPALCLHALQGFTEHTSFFFIFHISSCSVPAAKIFLITLYRNNPIASRIWNSSSWKKGHFEINVPLPEFSVRWGIPAYPLWVWFCEYRSNFCKV